MWRCWSVTWPGWTVWFRNREKVYKVYLKDSELRQKARHPDHGTCSMVEAVASVLLNYRFAGEARALAWCLQSGTSRRSRVNMPRIRRPRDGKVVGLCLPGGSKEVRPVQSSDETEHVRPVQYDLLNMIGVEIAKMHLADIIHGDLINSNMMLRKGSKIWSVPIDFGLAYHSTMVEDKAVGLYVLECFSTHDKHLGKHWSAIKKRLNDGCLRGRKRSVVG
ncbi:hypothetical protein EDC04DRAFT_2869506 [Pisolithus marmoratus]|nr:hypothetical protein EDC04DRAFT_2869506 [Pisolithus marmoratus]